MAQQMTCGEGAVALLVTLFDKYATADGDGSSMSRQEFKKMMKEEFPCCAKSECADKGENLFDTLDQSGDGVVDMGEFMGFMGSMAVMCHGFLCEAYKQCDQQKKCK